MIQISFRDPENPDKLNPNANWLCNEDLEIYIAARGKKKCLILIHGYNNTEGDAIHTYAKIERFLRPKDQFELIGLHWPSNGDFFAYESDIKDAKRSGHRLRDLIDLLGVYYEDVCLCSHSMGALLVANTLELLRPGAIYKWFTLAADVARDDMQLDGKYGKNFNRMDEGLHYYSPKDVVDLIFSPLANGTERLGALGLPRQTPINQWDFDANDYSDGEPVEHSTYFDLPDLWTVIFSEINDPVEVF